MDGTIWDSTPEVAKAFNKVLAENIPRLRMRLQRRSCKVFGLPLDVIAVKLYQSVSEEHAVKVMQECCDYECIYLAEHGATLMKG